ncbi:MAG: ATP-binding protein [Pararhodobacter sp.]
MSEDIISNETRLTRIQALVVDILNDLLRAPIDQTDNAINRAISRLGEYCARDRVYVFVDRGEVTDNTHEWVGDGIDPMKEHLQSLPMHMMGPSLEPLQRGEQFHVPDVAELEEGSPSRELLESQSIRSMLLVPMQSEGAPYGFVGFDGVHKTHSFLPGEVYLLQSVADVICSVLIRREKDLAVRAAQAELADERAFLASILATSAMGIVVLDSDGVIRFTNDAAETVLGVSRGVLIGARHDSDGWAYTREDFSPYIRGETPFDRVLRTGKPAPTERFALHCPDGLRYCSVHASPMLSGDGESDRVVYALLDVTDQVGAERQRQEALEDANRANAAKSNFLAKMSHEMRTPLNGVLGVAEVLERLINDPDQRRMVKVMHDSGALLLSIINDLLDMSKIEADQLELETVPFIPADLAQRVESVHTLKASEKQLSFAVSLSGDGQVARLGDPHRVLQILHNVISNALKFTESGSVQVALECGDPAGIWMMVRDTGIGMTRDQMAQVFEEFGQADSSIARRFGGTGLGMPIVHRLVEMMGGTIELTSAPGEGTFVQIYLPVPRTDLPETRFPLPDADQNATDLHGLRVLAADDNRTNRMILGAMMGQLGIAAVLVSDGTEALKAYEREEFDLVILDISMPDVDGVTVQREIRAREHLRAAVPDTRVRTRLPIIAFTANAMSHQVEGYLAAGFDDCLTKPLQIDRLRASLSTLITERGRRRPAGGVTPLRATMA